MTNSELETNGSDLVQDPQPISLDFPTESPVNVRKEETTEPTVGEQTIGRPSIDQRLDNIQKEMEESELKDVVMASAGKSPNQPKRMSPYRKEEMVAIVRAIDELCKRFPTWNDDALLKALRRRPTYQTWPEEVVKGLLLMKTTTANRLRDKKERKETSVQTEEHPSRWNIINRVAVREKLIVVKERASSEHEN